VPLNSGVSYLPVTGVTATKGNGKLCGFQKNNGLALKTVVLGLCQSSQQSLGFTRAQLGHQEVEEGRQPP
jgi:hypothetical protein